MGLKEKKLRTVIENENLPFHIRTFKDYCGGDLEIEIDWDAWMSDHEGLLNLNGYQIQQFTDALNLVGHDADSKEAMSEGVRKLRIERADGPEAKALKLADGSEPISRGERLREIAPNIAHAVLDLALFAGVIAVLYWTVTLALN